MISDFAISLVIGASVGGAVAGIRQVASAWRVLKDKTMGAQSKLIAVQDFSKSSEKTAINVASLLGSSAVALSRPAIGFESAMADVRKVVDFKTPEGFKNLSDDILKLTRTIPMTAEELATIAASGGQLGVAEQDLKAFTATIAKMSVAFDMSAQDSGDAMGCSSPSHFAVLQ